MISHPPARLIALSAVSFSLLLFGCASSESASQDSSQAAAIQLSGPFASTQAVFAENCTMCHGAGGSKGGINLTSAENVLKGGMRGPIVVAGDPEGSILVQAMRGQNGRKQMPMGRPPLTEDKISAVEAWIKDGAKVQ